MVLSPHLVADDLGSFMSNFQVIRRRVRTPAPEVAQIRVPARIMEQQRATLHRKHPVRTAAA